MSSSTKLIRGKPPKVSKSKSQKTPPEQKEELGSVEKRDINQQKEIDLRKIIRDKEEAIKDLKGKEGEKKLIEKELSQLKQKLAVVIQDLHNTENEKDRANIVPQTENELISQKSVLEKETDVRNRLVEIAKILGKEPPNFELGKDPVFIRRNIKLARSFFDSHEPTTVLIERFNDTIKNIEDATKEWRMVFEEKDKEDPSKIIKTEYISFDDVELEKPSKDQGSKISTKIEPLYPAECRRRFLSYNFVVKGRIKYELVKDGRVIQTNTEADYTTIAEIPCMLGSSMCHLDVNKIPKEDRHDYEECPNDPFGYFIAKGKSIRLVAQEKLSINTSILITENIKKGSDGRTEVEIYSQTPTKEIKKHICYEQYQSSHKTINNVGLFLSINDLTVQKQSLDLIKCIRILLIAQTKAFGTEENESEDASYDKAADIVDEISEELFSDNNTMRSEFKKYLDPTFSISRGIKDEELLEDPALDHNTPKDLSDSSELLSFMLERLFPHINPNTYATILDVFFDDMYEEEGLKVPKGEKESDYKKHLKTLLSYLLLIRYKIFMLLFLAYRLFMFRMINTESDDRDHFGLKRVHFAHRLVEDLYHKARQTTEKTLRNVMKEPKHLPLVEQIKKYFSGNVKGKNIPANITGTFFSSFTTKDWGVVKSRTSTKSVAEALDTESLAAMISNLRQVISKGEQAKRTVAPHLFHRSQDNLFCPFQTSDDQSCINVTQDISLSDGSYKPIGELKNGDEIITVDIKTGLYVKSKICNYFKRKIKENEDTYRITTISGRKLEVTKDHPFYTLRGIKEAQELTKTDKLLINDNSISEYERYIEKNNNINCIALDSWKSITVIHGECLYVPVDKVEKINTIREVADFTTVENTHSLIADGIVTSNCGIKKYLAVSADVSLEYPTLQFIRDFCEKIKEYNENRGEDEEKVLLYYPISIDGDPISFSDISEKGYLPLFINGTPVGHASMKILDIAREWRKTATSDNLPLLHIEIWLKRRVRTGTKQFQIEMHISTSADRMIRPLHYCIPTEEDPDVMELAIDKVQRENPNIDMYAASWEDLVFKYHVIGYVGKREEETYNQLVAWYPWELVNSNGKKYTRCEINPLFVFGYNSGSISYTEHQQGTRTAYGASQMNHSIGVPTQTYSQRFETTMKILLNPQQPLVYTEQFKAAGYLKQPFVTNLKIGIMSYVDNVEDATLINRGAIDRGALNSLTFSTVTVAAETNGKFDVPQVPPSTKVFSTKRERVGFSASVERLHAPKVVPGGYAHLGTIYPPPEEAESARKTREGYIPVEGGGKGGIIIPGESLKYGEEKDERYQKNIGEYKAPTPLPPGIARPGTIIAQGDVLATKVKPGAPSVIETKQTSKKNRTGSVYSAYVLGTPNGTGALAKVKTVYCNVFAAGDKVSQVNSQKGLAARLINPEDMPFDDSGETFDLIFNPHGIPSRQTQSLFRELLGTNARITGQGLADTDISKRSAQTYNRAYTIGQVKEFYLRPNLTANWFSSAAEKYLNELRKEYVEANKDDFMVRKLYLPGIKPFTFETLREEKGYKGEEADQKELETIISTGERSVLSYLYDINTKERIYKSPDEFTLSFSELPKLRVFHESILAAINKKRKEKDRLKTIADLNMVLYEKYSEIIYNTVYMERNPSFKVVSDIYEVLDDRKREKIWKIALASTDGEEDKELYFDGVDYEAIDRISLKKLRKFDKESVKKIEAFNEMKETISKLWYDYSQTDEGKAKMTKSQKGNVEQRVPISYIRKVDKDTYNYIKTEIKDKFVPIVDIVKISDKSKEAKMRFKRNIALREHNERIQQGSISSTAYNREVEPEELVDYLKSLGMNDGGLVSVYNGETGSLMQCQVMTGFVAYNTMTQQAVEAIQSRSGGGPLDARTRRHRPGKVAGGAIKDEEMARVVYLSHGAAYVNQAKLTSEESIAKYKRCISCKTVCRSYLSMETACSICSAKLIKYQLPWNSIRVFEIAAVAGIAITPEGKAISSEAYEETDRQIAELNFEEELENRNVLDDDDF